MRFAVGDCGRLSPDREVSFVALGIGEVHQPGAWASLTIRPPARARRQSGPEPGRAARRCRCGSGCARSSATPSAGTRNSAPGGARQAGPLRRLRRSRAPRARTAEPWRYPGRRSRPARAARPPGRAAPAAGPRPPRSPWPGPASRLVRPRISDVHSRTVTLSGRTSTSGSWPEAAASSPMAVTRASPAAKDPVRKRAAAYPPPHSTRQSVTPGEAENCAAVSRRSCFHLQGTRYRS